MLSFKATFSLSSFSFIKKRFCSSLSAIRVVSSAYLRLLIFFPAILIPACASSSGEGNGKPLQYSCLENPMNSMKRTTVHGVAKSQTRLSNQHFPFSHLRCAGSYCWGSLKSRWGACIDSKSHEKPWEDFIKVSNTMWLTLLKRSLLVQRGSPKARAIWCVNPRTSVQRGVRCGSAADGRPGSPTWLYWGITWGSFRNTDVWPQPQRPQG